MRSRMSGGVGGAAGAILPPRPDLSLRIPGDSACRGDFRRTEFLSAVHIAALTAKPDRSHGATLQDLLDLTDPP